jgi:hypothetical protein
VFLALGLGILMGTTVLNDSLVTSLQRRTETLQQTTSDLREQLDAALQRAAQAERFAADVQPFVLADRLADQPVVLVTVEGADGGALDEAAAVLDLAGAQTITTITVQPEIVPDGGSNTQELAKLLGLPANSSPGDLMAATADALAGRLAETAAHAGAGDDLLGQLLNGGFVVAPDLSDADLAEVGGAGQVIVVVGGASAASQPATQGFLTPLVGDLIDREMTTAAAEGSDRTSTFVSSIIDAVGSTALVTVDGLDQAVGGNALVLGIAQALETGEGGAFGVGDQMSQPLPPPPA